MISKGFYDSLEAIAEERSLDIEKVLAKIEDKDSLTLEQIIKQALSNF